MRAAWNRALPFLIGAALPWQTVWIFSKPNEFAAVQLFGWQIAFLGWWIGKGAPQRWQVVALWGAFSVPALFLENPTNALWHAAVLSVGFVVYATVQALTTEERRWWWRGLAAGFVPVALLAAVQVIAGFTPASTVLGLAERNADRLGESVLLINGERVLRAYGTFAHSNVLAAWSVIMALFGAQTKERWGRALLMAALIVVLLTASRAGLLSLMLAVVWWYRPRFLWPAATFTALVLWLTLFLTPHLLTVLRGGGALEQRSITERQEQTVQALHLLSQPHIALLGTGVAQSTLVQQGQNPGQPTYAYQPVHNTALLILIELGLPFTFLLATWLWQSRPHIPAALAVLAPFFAVDHLLWTSAVGPLMVALLALTARTGNLDGRLLNGRINQ